jgi:hypothetical protein
LETLKRFRGKVSGIVFRWWAARHFEHLGPALCKALDGKGGYIRAWNP